MKISVLSNRINEVIDLINSGITHNMAAEKLNVSKNCLRSFCYNHNLKFKTDKEYNKTDLIGQTFGYLFVIDFSHLKKSHIYLKCKCTKCGKIVNIYKYNLLLGKTKSCGCCSNITKSNRAKNNHNKYIGKKYGFLTIIKFVHKTYKNNKKRYDAFCICDCGNTIEVMLSKLKSGHTRSCGCYHRKQASQNNLNYISNYNWYFIQDNQKIKCRSSYEVIYANYLMRQNITFKYEPKTFKVDKNCWYTPDFYLVDTDEYIELKGYDYNKNQQKNRRLFSQNNKLSILYWNDIKKLPGIPYKSWGTYKKYAEKSNLLFEDYLAQQLYYNH